MKQIPLFALHEKLNARFTEFGGWNMPVQYSSIMDEHNAVRQHAGIFDTSHMGTFIFSGVSAEAFLNTMTTANISAVPAGKAKYSLLLNEKGGIIDDLIIYRRKNDFLMVVNAGNAEKDWNWFSSRKPADVDMKNISGDICLLALQGPDSVKLLQPMVKDDLAAMKYFSFIEKPTFTVITPAFGCVARTGYTGEDGFEIFISRENASVVWESLVAAGAKPAGLGCRDTLRLEACMPLHGHEITDDITPLEAELGWAVYWDKEFIGKAALVAQKAAGLKNFLTAFIAESGIPRAGCRINVNGKLAGMVVSGTYSPTFKKGLGVGYVNASLAEGAAIEIEIHGQMKAAKVVARPFYKRKKN